MTSNPAGINCGQACSATYPSGTQAILTTMADPGFAFAGWGGDCARCGSSTTCQITMDANKTCTATFNTQQQPTPSPSPTPSPTPQPSPEPTPGGGGGGGCSMGAGASPINALAYMLLPMLVALRRFIRR